jgi:hypothetical protein
MEGVRNMKGELNRNTTYFVLYRTIQLLLLFRQRL